MSWDMVSTMWWNQTLAPTKSPLSQMSVDGARRSSAARTTSY